MKLYNVGVEKAMNGETIELLYTCGTCTVIDRPLTVPVRGEEDVKAWMDATIKLLVIDHQKQTPGCTATSFKMVKIPSDNRTKVGGPVVN